MTKADADCSREQNSYKGNRGLARAWHALKNSWSGMRYAIREESAFRQELLGAACLIPLALLLPFGAIERVMLIWSVLLIRKRVAVAHRWRTRARVRMLPS
ncbi:MAG: diacylglycerol kinase [Steroidobacteraceae bacterium]